MHFNTAFAGTEENWKFEEEKLEEASQYRLRSYRREQESYEKPKSIASSQYRLRSYRREHISKTKRNMKDSLNTAFTVTE
jgi:hypothetical protein